MDGSTHHHSPTTTGPTPNIISPPTTTKTRTSTTSSASTSVGVANSAPPTCQHDADYHVQANLHTIAAAGDYPTLPDALCCFDTFAGSAEDHGWKSWTDSTADRPIDSDRLEAAERLLAATDTTFGRRLAEHRAGALDIEPVPSGQKLVPWLLLLSEDVHEPTAADVYWTLRSGFTSPTSNLRPIFDLGNFCAGGARAAAPWL